MLLYRVTKSSIEHIIFFTNVNQLLIVCEKFRKSRPWRRKYTLLQTSACRMGVITTRVKIHVRLDHKSKSPQIKIGFKNVNCYFK